MNTDEHAEPSGTLPSCAAVLPCAALPLQDSVGKYDVSSCSRVAAGSACYVTPTSQFKGPPSEFTCPTANVDYSTEPIGTLLPLLPVVGCAALSSPGIAFDVSKCATVMPGKACTIDCASGFSLAGKRTTFSCPGDNVSPATEPSGPVLPVCLPVVPCTATPGANDFHRAGLDLSACTSVPAGGSCPVSCSDGFIMSPVNQYYSPSGAAWSFSCPEGNTNPYQDVSGVPPLCREIVPCARLDSSDEYMSNCVAVPSGSTCTVTCATGFSTWFLWTTRESEFTCPLRNLDESTQPRGVNPRCVFFDSLLEDALVAAIVVAAVAAVATGTWLVVTLISSSGGGCCCCAISGRVVYNKTWNKLQKEIVEAVEAGKVVDAINYEIQELESYFDQSCSGRCRRCFDCRTKTKVQRQLDKKRSELVEAERAYNKELRDVDAAYLAIADTDGDGKISPIEFKQLEIERLGWQVKELELYFAGGCWGCFVRCIDCKSDSTHRRKITELKVKRISLQQEVAKERAAGASECHLTSTAQELRPSAPPIQLLYPAPLASPESPQAAKAAAIQAKIREKQATLRLMQDEMHLPESQLVHLRVEIDQLEQHPSLRTAAGSFRPGAGSVAAISIDGISFSSLSEGTPPSTSKGSCRAIV
jgi:hypothetical protein